MPQCDVLVISNELPSEVRDLAGHESWQHSWLHASKQGDQMLHFQFDAMHTT